MSESVGLKIPKLSRDGDYRTWSTLMRAYLITQDRLDKALEAAPAASDSAAVEKDLLCRARLQLHVTGPLQSIVARAKTAKAAWDALKADHEGSLRTRQPQLTAQLTRLCQGNDSVIAYTDRLLVLRDEFEALGMESSLPLLASQFIRGLRDDLRLACAPILHKVGEKKGSTIDDIAQEIKTLALLLPDSASKGGSPGRVHQADGGRTRTQPTCWNCDQQGHRVSDCPRPRDEARIQRNKAKFTSRKRRGRDLKKSSSDNPPHVMAVSSAAVANLRKRSEALWLDSGATHHVVFDAGMLRNTRTPSVPLVTLGGGEEHIVTCEGDMLLTGGPRGPVLITGVLHVPTLGINLVSTPQLTSKNASCWEGPHFARLYNSEGQIVIRGHRVDGMYKLDCVIARSCAATLHTVSADTWHRRFGHVGYSSLQKMQKSGAVKGLAEAKLESSGACDVCDRAKLTRAQFPRSPTKAKHVLDLVHSDTMGPLPVPGLEDEMYVVTALDDFSGYAETILIRAKSEAASAVVDLLVRWQRQTGRKVKTLRTDQGTEFLGVLAEYCRRKGIERQLSTAYTPEQNGRAERLNRTLIERARALLMEHELPKAVWSEAMMTASYIRNRCSSTHQKTPYEMFYNEVPDVSHLRVYGCKAYAYVEKDDRGKLDATSEEHALVGYSNHSKAYRLLRPGVNGELTVVEAISVRFHEDSPPSFLSFHCQKEPVPHITGAGIVAPGLQLDPEYQPELSDDSGNPSNGNHDTASMEDDNDAEEGSDAQGTGREAQGEDDGNTGEKASVTGSNEMGNDVEKDMAEPVPGPEVPVVPEVPLAEGLVAAEDTHRRYPKRDRHPPTEWYRVNVPRLHSMDGLTDTPSTYTEAMQRPDKDQWQQAITEELSSLHAKGVYTEVSAPPDTTPLPSKLVFAIKRDEQGRVDKYKARLVAKGFRQVAGKDYEEVFAPTAQHVTLRILLATASSKGLELDQMDVKTAFLNGELSSDVYIKLPASLGGQVWLLHKALYGLKQAARAWFSKLRTSMLEHGFSPSQHDPCLFFRGEGTDRVYVMVHVDDALIAGARDGVDKVKKSMARMFEVKDMGHARHFLGMTIERHEDGAYSLMQPKYIEDLLHRFHMPDCKPTTTPLPVGLKLSKDLGAPLPDGSRYQTLVGSLLYLSVNTRPDIAHACGVLSRFMTCPTKPHWEAAKYVLRYLKGTSNLGLKFSGRAASNQGVLACEMFTDADFAADVDKRRSTTGAVMLMHGAAILWISKLQSVVATSTTEAEFIAAAMGTKEGLWVRKMLAEMSGIAQPLKLAVDNQAAVVLVAEHTAGQSGRTKHIDVQYQFVRDRFQRGDVSIQFVPTMDQRADMFTKQLCGPEFRRHRSVVLGMDGDKDTKTKT